ncbi:MAG TPA: hypothetical protein VGD77_03995 [Gemmatimonadaceae bacterium]
MNGAHLHLLLNHLPVLGTVFGLGILAMALWRRNDTLRRTGLALLVLAGVTAGAAFFTGEPAEEAVEGKVAEQSISAHEEAAEAALWGAGILAVLSAGALLRWRRELPQGVTAGLLVGAIVTSGLMAWTANLGGQIRHPEIGAPTVASRGAAGDSEARRD